MKVIAIAGGVGKDAEHRTAGNGEVCSFSVAVTEGWGDNKKTVWFDVSRWGKGAPGLANTLVKGSRVAVSGEFSTREHNGKTYLQVRADNVTILSTPNTGETKEQRREPDGSRGGKAQDWGEDLSDDIPFITNRSIY